MKICQYFIDNIIIIIIIIIINNNVIIRVASRTLAESTVEFFFILVKLAKLVKLVILALVIRNSILDFVELLDPPLFSIIILQVRLQLPGFVQITLLTYL